MTSTVKLPSNSSGNPNILPMPLNNSSPVSTAPDIISLDYYFWNQSLPADDVVCTADITENIAEACCPPAIGLWSTAGLGYGACRMRNTKANEEYHKNCTAQYALELNVSGTPEAVNATCTPFTTYLNVSRQERHDRLANAPTTNLHLDKGVESVPMCASVGDPGHWNYTGQCCAKVNGHSSATWMIDLPHNETGIVAMNCYPSTNDPEFSDRFSQCLEEFGTYPTCATLNSTGQPGSSGRAEAGSFPRFGVLFVGVVLALLV